MERKYKRIINLTVLIAAAILILDAKVAAEGVTEGIVLCLETVIPSLFPFVFLSGMLCQILVGQENHFLRPLGRLCRIPTGSEGIFLIGLIAGYPTGATMISRACKDGSLTKSDGCRMLGFCNQAGPAFLFGMFGPIFKNQALLWILWTLQILSAIVTAIILPGGSQFHYTGKKVKPTSVAESLHSAIQTMGTVCGWVILFRIILVFAKRWFLWLLPAEIQVLIFGILELSNGCSSMIILKDPSLLLIISGFILSFGGVCVGMQTVSICKDLKTGLYFPGKLLQSSINCLLSILVASIIMPNTNNIPMLIPVMALLAAITTVLLLYRKKVVAFCGRILYNNRKYYLERG